MERLGVSDDYEMVKIERRDPLEEDFDLDKEEGEDAE